MDKKSFVGYMERIEKDADYLGELSRLKVNVFEGLHCVDDAINLLEIIMEDSERFISWWCEDNNFGKSKFSVFLGEEEYLIPNSCELYDFLILRQKQKKDRKNSKNLFEVYRRGLEEKYSPSEIQKGLEALGYTTLLDYYLNSVLREELRIKGKRARGDE